MTHVTGFNATSGPLLIDRAGHVLGSGEYAPVREDEQPAKGHLAAGRLLAVESPQGADPEQLNPDAIDAFVHTAEANGGSPPAAPAAATAPERASSGRSSSKEG